MDATLTLRPGEELLVSAWAGVGNGFRREVEPTWVRATEAALQLAKRLQQEASIMLDRDLTRRHIATALPSGELQLHPAFFELGGTAMEERWILVPACDSTRHEASGDQSFASEQEALEAIPALVECGPSFDIEWTPVRVQRQVAHVL